MILANLYRMVKLPFADLIKDARRLSKKSELECRKETRRLETFVREEMLRQHFHHDLVYECPIETIPYNLFLCKMDWVEGIGERPECRSSCAGEIGRWNDYHVRKGIEDFPPGWYGQLANEDDYKVKIDVSPPPREYAEFDIGKDFGEKQLGVLMSIDDINGYDRRKRQHGLLPHRVPKRFVKEFLQTNQFSIGNWTRQARCRDDEWPFAIEDNLPFGITIHCWGPMGFSGTHTLGNMNHTKLGQKPAKPRIMDCNQTVEYKPPNGTLLIGMSNRVNYGTFEFLVAGVFLCSGELKWRGFLDREGGYDTKNGTGEVAHCKPGTIMCTLELKMTEFENKLFTTNVRVGCCEAPERLFHSSLTLVPMRTIPLSDSSGHFFWSDNFKLVLGDLLDLKNLSLIKRVELSKDYFAEPYGGFITNVAQAKAGFTHSGNPYWLLYFGYAHFNNMNMKEWPDQNPVLNDVPHSYQKCKGFVKGLKLKLCGPTISLSLICTSGDLITLVSDCDRTHTFKFECPPGHLICGVRKAFPTRINGGVQISWAAYRHTYICCPVVHTAKSICGTNGVILSKEDAEVNCLSVNGADTKCTTKQTYGYSMGKEIMSGTTVDANTEKSYGYSTTNRVETIASSITSITSLSNNLVSAGFFGIGAKVEAGGSLTSESMITDGVETTNSQTNTNTASISEGFSFSKAMRQEAKSERETTTEYTILDGQRPLFYDVVKTCGETKIKSEDFIRILTPTIKCDPKITLEYMFGWRTTSHGFGKRTFTFSGFGLDVEDDTYAQPLDRGVDWDLFSRGVKEKFTESIPLNYENRSPVGGYDFKRAPLPLWQRSSDSIRFNYTVDLQNPLSYRFYRVVGKCGRWRAITNKIFYQKDQESILGYMEAPPSPTHELFTSPSIWVLNN